MSSVRLSFHVFYRHYLAAFADFKNTVAAERNSGSAHLTVTDKYPSEHYHDTKRQVYNVRRLLTMRYEAAPLPMSLRQRPENLYL